MPFGLVASFGTAAPRRGSGTGSAVDGHADPDRIGMGVRGGVDGADLADSSGTVVGAVVMVKFAEHWPVGTTTWDGTLAALI